MLRRIFRAVLIAAGIAAVFVIVSPALVFMLMAYGYFFAPSERSPTVTSPDGRMHAYVKMRGALDSYNFVLHVQRAHGRPKRLCRVIAGDLKWAPDSRKIAVVRSDHDGLTVEVIDTVTGSLACGGSSFRTGVDGKSPDRSVDCQWRDSDTLLCAPFSLGKPTTKPKLLRVVESKGTLRIEGEK